MEVLWNCSIYIIIAIFCVLSSCTTISDIKHMTQKSNKTQQQYDNFLIIDHLNDNEKEIRIKWKDLMGKQTTLDVQENKRYVNSSLKLTSLWQLTNGKSFAQLIFNGKNLLDCEYIEDGNEIASDFVDKFIDEYHYIRNEKLSSAKHAKHHQYHESENIDKDVLTIKANVRLTQIKKFLDIPEDIMNLMNLKKLKKQCNKLHKEIKRKLQHEYTDMEENEEDLNAEQKEESTGLRAKRQTDSWFIAPNTKWCGSGSNANEYKELGPSKADQCCRKHDICKVHIPPIQKRYGLFNIRPFTLSHCKCDRRFRTCLKMADSSDANMVGKLFFNIIQTKCFVLKSENTCILYSWWGKCLKYKAKKKAYLRDNQKY
ncbi:uncharacterized protein GIIIspla2 isoform X1 [Chironomus tepperi]|uniref:uncharacterized protein GIIIspla2 isoform X1 n=1 Tax=Chironomus tepperi TaxID=113505 RepID=UPI00391F4053